MSAVKKTISIDEEVAKEAGTYSSNFSAVVETALIEYIQRQRAQKAIDSFGKWGDRGQKSSADLVKDLRSRDDREYVSRNDKGLKREHK